MQRPECTVKNCQNNALVAYGTNWICGDCYIKIYNKQKEQREKEVEELGNDN